MIRNRWTQMAAGIGCMAAISSPQYVWTLFTPDLRTAFNCGAPLLQVTFSLLIVLQTLFSPVQGFVARHITPRLLITTGIVLTGSSWIAAAFAHRLLWFSLAYGVLGGIGTGIVYVGIVALLMGWFPGRRGMAAGAAAAGYGMGAMVTTLPIAHMLGTHGWRATLFAFGLAIIVLGTAAAALLRAPPVPPGEEAVARPAAGVIRTPIFWLLFAMMATMATSGLMVTSQLAQIARDFGAAGTIVLGVAALPLAMTLDRVANGLTRPMFGALSDRIGRETTMAVAFTLEAIALLMWLSLAGHPIWFVLLSGVVFLGWGEIFSLFPAVLADIFGARDAARNYGFLYMAQGVGAIAGGPMAAALHQHTGSWSPVFALAICGDLLTACAAIALLRPMRRRFQERRASRSDDAGKTLLPVESGLKAAHPAGAISVSA